ncbi:carnitine dehydratase (plasmid) [Novosphingobium pentaromativorans US6-1]|uniref:L-carnitine dehydratase/bile acid-inducible protein F n=2 Tax=Novosphingobium pentaromativorans TaxID=205844 RepID=G6EGA8_9SPHN|nr:carnitine dehydratase [Novosphingobium pentaromativorans US6-1]EHJ59797.1 L-carnitine dehydratase/bile acid-inducible protein F [Novosphingobium pentaromativorans US6-1]
MAGIRVIDFSQIAAGPLCSMLLADLGAVVIKVEPPSGDIARGLGPPFANGESVLHLSLNRNKYSITADLKDAEDRERVMRLVADADVVIEGYRPGVAQRLGLSFDDVRKINPDAVYCSISAFGQHGPWSRKAGVDGVIQAVSGLMSITGDADSPPSKVQTPIVDMSAGLQATVAILAALAKRDKGEGVGHIDINLFSSALIMQQITLTSYLMSSELPLRTGSGAPYATPNEAYRTADGYILVAAYQKAHWPSFCRIIERPELFDAPEYADLATRLENREQLTAQINAALMKHPTAYWLEQFDDAGLICAPIADYEMVSQLEQLDELRAIVTCDHAKAGALSMIGFAIGGASPPVRLTPPLLGEHNGIAQWPEAN